jgi:hypothetical protein
MMSFAIRLHENKLQAGMDSITMTAELLVHFEYFSRRDQLVWNVAQSTQLFYPIFPYKPQGFATG